MSSLNSSKILDYNFDYYLFLLFQFSACNCDPDGSLGPYCDPVYAREVSGEDCICKPNIGGYKCDVCVGNTFNFPTCERKQ